LDFVDRFRAIRLHDRTPERVVALIPSARPELLAIEHKHPGALVLNELKGFGATPFGYSSNMDDFYRHGIGMAVELADTMHDRNKEYMISFVLSALLFRSDVRLLSVGDGIANDSIRLSRAGCRVSYLDFDDGKMTQIAKHNVADANTIVEFVTNDFANENPFEFVMCFEVMEHVEDPDVLIRSLARKTRPGGIAFVSECFVGVEDQWPTHLYSNEKFTGMLPAMMDPWFELLDMHRAVPGKPFMFRRTEVPFDADVPPSVRRWFMNASTYGALQTAFQSKTNSFVHF
jgi:SAM-dependent methyltransferase